MRASDLVLLSTRKKIPRAESYYKQNKSRHTALRSQANFYLKRRNEMSSKRRIAFGMIWQVAGTQTIEIPDELDVTDRNAVTAYLKENWEKNPDSC